jgi:hypothetical protein
MKKLLIILALLSGLVPPAFAEEEGAKILAGLTGLDLAVGKVYSQYSDTAKSEHEWAIKVGLDEFPVYIFAGYEEPGSSVLGQDLGANEIVSVGLGARFHLVENVRVFIEFGYASVDHTSNPEIVDEVAYSYLVKQHAAVGQNARGQWTSRRVPVSGGPYDDYDTEYSLDDGFLGRIGVGYNLHNNIMVTASYKVLVVDEYIALKDQEVIQNTGGWWEEHNTRDFNAFEIGLFLTY